MKNIVNVALPKGRLGDKVYGLFEKIGYDCPSIKDPGRKLLFENADAGVRYFWVKPSDVPIYVERGVADVGVAGKDILLEFSPDVYELCDLRLGKCRMAVASKRGFRDFSLRSRGNFLYFFVLEFETHFVGDQPRRDVGHRLERDEGSSTSSRRARRSLRTASSRSRR